VDRRLESVDLGLLFVDERREENRTEGTGPVAASADDGGLR
jgi:hypothetical protein